MAQTIRHKLSALVDTALESLFERGVLGPERPAPVNLTEPKQKAHGDFACNAALPLAKTARKNPRVIADALCDALGDGGGMLAKTEVAGPGFVNLFVSDQCWREALADILAAGPDYIRSNVGCGRRVLVEFVSANPTGPLHIAHGRGAVTGDLIARLLTAAGYEVGREYYVNDLGHQVEILGESVFLRYGELHGRSFDPPEEIYPGAYVTEIAEEIAASEGERFLDLPRDEWLPFFRDFAVETMLRRIEADLAAFGITFDRFVSERAITTEVGLQPTLDQLQARGHIYEEEGKRWFRSTAFGDDKDRVVAREDGTTTYFASDIAYHHDKLQRGFETLINVWGADHGGYVKRVKAGIEALGYGGDPLEVILIQMVSLTRGGEAVRMGKRLGTAVWLQEVVDEAGRDATRYFFAMRRAEAQLDFDIELATKKSLDNPVYYAQMGHARLCSIARKADEAGVPQPSLEPGGALDPLVLPEELGLIKAMANAPEVVAQAAAEREPHQIVHYIQDLIAQFHSYYSQFSKTERVISDSAEKTRARLLLCRALRQLLAAFLIDILGVDAPAEMYLEDDREMDSEVC